MRESNKPETIRNKRQKEPRIKADGTVDGRIHNKGLPLGEKPMLFRVGFRLDENHKIWLENRPEGATAWLRSKIEEEKNKGI